MQFQCYKFVPVVQTGRYFENEDDVQFWVTADKNRIPVLVKAKIPVGTVKSRLHSALKASRSARNDSIDSFSVSCPSMAPLLDEWSSIAPLEYTVNLIGSEPGAKSDVMKLESCLNITNPKQMQLNPQL